MSGTAYTTRTSITDDDGTGTTGTVINNAWKSELYGQVDDAINAAVRAVEAVTNLETAARFATTSQINGTGANTFGAGGAALATGATISSSTGLRWTLGGANESLFGGSPF